MGDPRIGDFCANLLDLAGAYLEKMPTRDAVVKLGSRTVAIHTPDLPIQCGIDPLAGLIRVDRVPPTTDFEITCVDAQGPTSLPTGVWPSTWHGPLGVIRAHRTDPYRVALDRHTQTISVFHVGLGRGVIWTWDFSLMPYWAAATPWRLMLSWCADTFDAEMVHAACLTSDNRAVLLVGRSGAGKSTLTLQAVEDGFGLIGDDFALVHDSRIYPVYTRAKAHDDTLVLLGESWLVLNPDSRGEKRIIDIKDRVATTDRRGTPIAAVVVPRQGNSSALTPISRGAALRSLAPYSLSGLLGGTGRSLMRMRRLVEPLPTFRLDVSRERSADLQQLAGAWKR